MVLHDRPSFLGITIILLHHFTGSAIETGPMTTSSLRLCFTSSFQCSAIEIGVCCAYCVYPALRWIWVGLVETDGKGVDFLKALSLNFSKMYFSTNGTFSVVGRYGSFFGYGERVWYDGIVLVLSVDVKHIFYLWCWWGMEMLLEGCWYQYNPGNLDIFSQFYRKCKVVVGLYWNQW